MVFAATLLQYWIVKVLGGIYLLWIAFSHLSRDTEGEAVPERKSRFGDGFWGTVDRGGSDRYRVLDRLDPGGRRHGRGDLPDRLRRDRSCSRSPSVNVVVDVKLMVIYIGGILGIIAMRFVAGYFLVLLDRFQGLAKGAYYLVGWIGLKLLGGGLHDAVHPGFVPGPGNWRENLPAWADQITLEIPSVVFWAVMGLIIVASLAYKPKPKKTDSNPASPGGLVASARSTD